MENSHTKSSIFKNTLPFLKGIVLLVFLITQPRGLNAQVLKALIPEAAVAQYGGSIGYGSAGIGYEFFKEDRGTLDLTYGYVPQSKGGRLNIVAGKFSYKTSGIRIKDLGTLYLINPGVFVSYHAGKQFSKWDKEQYPGGYYWWSKAFRYHLSLSQEMKLKGKKLFPKAGIKAIGLYSEFNTNDLYAVSWFQNRDQLSFFDIVRVGYGVRVYF